MATYKVLQDIEAEDEFLGPLTLRQFIYAAVATVSGYASFFALSRGIWIVLILMAPIILFSVFLAWPWSKDQPTEVWLLAKIRFFVKPRRRIWDRSGLKELVTITAPKRVEKIYTNNLTQSEVTSRLRALADTIDSRGWAVKNVNVNLFASPTLIQTKETDRLVDPSSIPQEVPAFDILASDDILDAQNNPVAQKLDQMITKSAAAHRNQLVAMMQSGGAQKQTTSQAPNDYWFMNEPQRTAVPTGQAVYNSVTVHPGDPTAPTLPSPQIPDTDDAALLERVHRQHDLPASGRGHLKTILPIAEQKRLAEQQAAIQQSQSKTVTAAPDPAILELAKNDDLNVATIARQAQKAQAKDMPDDEVVISLH